MTWAIRGMAMPELLTRLNADVLRQLDEEGWLVSAQDDSSIHLMSDEVGSSRHVYIRMTEEDSEVFARVELIENLQTTATRQCSAPATNISNLLDVGLGLAATLLGR